MSEKAKVKEIKKTPLQILFESKYDPAKEPEQGQVIITIDQQCIGTLQNFICITAMEKGGKGKFIAPIITGALTTEPCYGIATRLPADRRRVALFDTEQGDYNFYKSIVNIKRMVGVDQLPDHFDAFKLRKFDPDEILAAIEQYLNLYPDCSLLVIDGLLDLIYSFNDEDKCSRLVKRIMILTEIFNCIIVAALHRSKTAGNTIGHLGSFANRKAQSVLLVEKNKERGSITMQPEFLRDAHTFDPIEIFYNRHTGLWEQTQYIADEDKVIRMKKPKPAELDIEVHHTNVRRIFYTGSVQRYSELIDGICEMYAAGQNWAKECVPYLIGEGLIFKIKEGYTNSREAKLFVQSN